MSGGIEPVRGYSSLELIIALTRDRVFLCEDSARGDQKHTLMKAGTGSLQRCNKQTDVMKM